MTDSCITFLSRIEHVVGYTAYSLYFFWRDFVRCGRRRIADREDEQQNEKRRKVRCRVCRRRNVILVSARRLL